MLYKEILEEDYCKTVEELKNINCTVDPISGKILNDMPSIAELMEAYGTNSCFFFWRLVAQYFSPQVNILESKIKLYVKVQIPAVKEEVAPAIYAVLPYYEYADILKLYPNFAANLQSKLLTVADTNIVLKFVVPEAYLKDYTAILSSRYSTVSKQYLNLSTSLSIANQACLRKDNLLDQWKRIAKVLNVDLNDLVAEGEVFPKFDIKKETYVSTHLKVTTNGKATDYL
mgnify:FL=1